MSHLKEGKEVNEKEKDSSRRIEGIGWMDGEEQVGLFHGVGSIASKKERDR